MAATTTTSHRNDIQGLRAVAVLVVVLFHAGVPGLSGGFVGVDLFFVLSGYLIIGLIATELATTGRIRFAEFWARRARRLIPASALVIIATVTAATLILPFLERKDVAVEAFWSSLFAANWHFALTGDEYANADAGASPLQHFWSLGVEEQFYIVAPLLLAAFTWVVLARATSGRRVDVAARVRAAICLLLTFVIVASLVYCVWLSATNPLQGYFDSAARAWQLAAGGLLGLLMVGRRVSLRTSHWLGASGVLLLVASVVVFTEGTPTFGLNYPSLLAVAPTAAGLLLLASHHRDSWLSRALSVRPLTHVGDISYSLYLWHWPFLVLGGHLFGTGSLVVNLALVAGAFVAAEATYHGVENPIRFAHALRRIHPPVVSIVMGASLVAVSLTVAYGVQAQEPEATRVAAPNEVGNMVVPDPDSDESTPVRFDDTIFDLRPDPADAPTDNANVKGCQVPPTSTEVNFDGCVFGNPNANKTVMVVGDSTSTAMLPAVLRAGADQWRVVLLAKSACTIADVDRYRGTTKKDWPECREWRGTVVNEILDRAPDLVVVGAAQHSMTDVLDEDGNVMAVKDSIEPGRDGLVRVLQQFVDADIDVALLQSPIRSEFDIPACLSEEASVSACTFTDENPQITDLVAEVMPEVTYVKTRRDYCTDACYPVADRTIVYRDQMHFTKTFAVRFATQLKRVLDQSA